MPEVLEIEAATANEAEDENLTCRVLPLLLFLRRGRGRERDDIDVEKGC